MSEEMVEDEVMSEKETDSETWHTAAATIHGALQLIERDNTQLKRRNGALRAELRRLRSENADLRREHATLREAYDVTRQKMAEAEECCVQLKVTVEQTGRQLMEIGGKLQLSEQEKQREAAKFGKELDKVRRMYDEKEVTLCDTLRELEILRASTAAAAAASKPPVVLPPVTVSPPGDRRMLGDREVELLHELEMLQTEKTGWLVEREDAEKVKAQLRGELARLQTTVDEAAANMRNEKRRHAVLAREFNSLLEENNHLKLQVRARRAADFPTYDLQRGSLGQGQGGQGSQDTGRSQFGDKQRLTTSLQDLTNVVNDDRLSTSLRHVMTDIDFSQAQYQQTDEQIISQGQPSRDRNQSIPATDKIKSAASANQNGRANDSVKSSSLAKSLQLQDIRERQLPTSPLAPRLAGIASVQLLSKEGLLGNSRSTSELSVAQQPINNRLEEGLRSENMRLEPRPGQAIGGRRTTCLSLKLIRGPLGDSSRADTVASLSKQRQRQGQGQTQNKTSGSSSDENNVTWKTFN